MPQEELEDLRRPWALGASWSLGGLGRPRALGASWSEVRGASHLAKLSLPDIWRKLL